MLVDFAIGVLAAGRFTAAGLAARAGFAATAALAERCAFAGGLEFDGDFFAAGRGADFAFALASLPGLARGLLFLVLLVTTIL